MRDEEMEDIIVAVVAQPMQSTEGEVRMCFRCNGISHMVKDFLSQEIGREYEQGQCNTMSHYCCHTVGRVCLKTVWENVRRGDTSVPVSLPVILVQVHNRTVTMPVNTGCLLSIASRGICQSWTKGPVCTTTIEGETSVCCGIGVVALQLQVGSPIKIDVLKTA